MQAKKWWRIILKFDFVSPVCLYEHERLSSNLSLLPPTAMGQTPHLKQTNISDTQGNFFTPRLTENTGELKSRNRPVLNVA